MTRRKIRYETSNDYYTFLGVAATATAEEIQRAFRSRAKQLHPDLNKEREAWAKEQFQLLNEAYGILSDADARGEYDRQRNAASGRAWWDVPQSPREPPPYTPPQYSSKIFTDEAEDTSWYSTWQTYPPPSSTTSTASATVLRGLFLGPYRYVLAVLTIMFAANITFIFMIQRNVQGTSRAERQATARAAVQATQQSDNCPDPSVRITVPTEGVFVDWTNLTVRGTANHPALDEYVLSVETRNAVGETLETRVLARGGTPKTEANLIEAADISSLKPALYTYLRLAAVLKDGSHLSPCLVEISR
ncbi:MAG: hypothetical protein OHK0023_22980 [Anaerolineae bacterium]